MTLNTTNMDNKIVTTDYKRPILKKYGTMKELTFAIAGSFTNPSANQPNLPGFDDSTGFQ